MTIITIESGHHHTDFWMTGTCPLSVDADTGHGIIDDDAVTAFTRGQCHAFALAAHYLTGLPMVLYTDDTYSDSIHEYADEHHLDPDEPDALIHGEWAHAAIDLGDGQRLDVNGIDTIDRWKGYDGFTGLTEQGILDAASDPDLDDHTNWSNGKTAFPVNVIAAIPFARAVLAAHGIPELSTEAI